MTTKLQQAIEALEIIRMHHIALNNQVSRPIERSSTLKWCEEALAALRSIKPATEEEMTEILESVAGDVYGHYEAEIFRACERRLIGEE